jgi:gluconokinase
MNPQTPCSDYIETRGVMFFARMLDKIRLHSRGQLPEGYNLGFADPTSFDARFCRFWEIDYEEARALPNAEQALVWNSFLTKRGWRDEGAAGLQRERERSGFGARADVCTWVDLHDAEEGRPLRFPVL